MDPLTGTALIAAGTSAVSSGGNLLSDHFNRKWQAEQNAENAARQDYWNYKSRDWAVEDRDYMNKYNSPSQQMERMKEAGLNPNLLYGKFEAGQSQMPRQSSAQAAQGKPKTASNPLDVVSGLNMYNAVQESIMKQKLFKEELRSKQIQNQRDNLNLRREMDVDILRGLEPSWKGSVVGEWQTVGINNAIKLRENERQEKLLNITTRQAYENLLKTQMENKVYTEFERKQAQEKLLLLQNENEKANIENELLRNKWNPGTNKAWQMFDRILEAMLRSKY